MDLMVTMSLQLDEELHARIKAYAERIGRTAEDAVLEMLGGISGDEIELTPEQEEELAASIAEADRGETVSKEEVFTQLRTLRR